MGKWKQYSEEITHKQQEIVDGEGQRRSESCVCVGLDGDQTREPLLVAMVINRLTDGNPNGL